MELSIPHDYLCDVFWAEIPTCDLVSAFTCNQWELLTVLLHPRSYHRVREPSLMYAQGIWKVADVCVPVFGVLDFRCALVALALIFGPGDVNVISTYIPLLDKEQVLKSGPSVGVITYCYLYLHIYAKFFG